MTLFFLGLALGMGITGVLMCAFVAGSRREKAWRKYVSSID